MSSEKSSKLIGLNTATFLVIANMIGTAVFTSICFQIADIHSGMALIMLWVIGGLISICGAFVYGELASVFPRSGGEYNLLSNIYHPAIGFIAGWVSITVGFAAPVALSAMTLGIYLQDLFPQIDALRVSIAVIIFITIIHSISIKYGSLFQSFFTSFKIILIALLILGGLFLVPASDTHFNFDHQFFRDITSAPFAVSLFYISYAYSGWNAAAYFAGEVKNGKKNVPRALLFGTMFVTIIYVGLNYIFLRVIPFHQIPMFNPSASKTSIDVGIVAAKYIFGSVGGKLFGAALSIALMASVSSMIFAGPRVTETMGEDYTFFKFATIKNKQGAPYVATLIQMMITILLVLFQKFDAVFEYIGFTLNLITTLTVIGIFVVRYKKLNTADGYKTWGYPITPVIFIGYSLYIIYFLLQKDFQKIMLFEKGLLPFSEAIPVSIVGFLTVLSGLIFYYFSPKKKTFSSVKKEDEPTEERNFDRL